MAGKRAGRESRVQSHMTFALRGKEIAEKQTLKLIGCMTVIVPR